MSAAQKGKKAKVGGDKPHETEVAKERRSGVDALRARLAVEAEIIVHEKMPAKILELTKVLEEGDLWKYPTHDDVVKAVSQSTGGGDKKRKIDELSPRKHSNATEIEGAANGVEVKSDFVFASNSAILQQQEYLKSEIQDCLQMLSKVKIWIHLNIPKVEDGNNFGVSIQEDTVNELTKAEDTSFSLLEAVNKYFMTRGKLVSRMAKYPGLHDYAKSVQEVDRRERVNLCLSLYDLRNNYFILFDSITKNMDKIKKPRSAHDLPFT
ncbi:proteasome activator pa28 [Baffinella frigidus]|nr:proteasome activator pa28 [Cryptophyta sp. CCMP2293]